MAIDKKKTPEVNAGSMADIAFLLLIFFLVTTTIASDKGLQVLLPPKKEKDQLQDVEVKDKNVFKVLLNSRNQLLVEDEPMDIAILKEEAKKFINNNGADKKSSDSPQDAVVSLKTDRGTKYSIYIRVLDDLKAAYNELRAEKMGISIDNYLDFDVKKASKEMKAKFEDARKTYPLQLSEAEPSNVEVK
jgi:biopolymer transport protein ExbD